MTRYLVTYHGGGMPEGAEARQQAMQAFGAWVASAGPALVDPGAPLGAARTVSPAGTAEGPASGPAGGYSILEADSIDAAVELVRTHPFVGRGGSLQVSEAVAP
ncbi:MAG: hypothetical protein QOC82_825 [Frankiaceae bacterium]|jgi:hypothetical protein|nr:hypothetical protein [Frankiaceae bacterium]